jgi:DNA-binding transcriptional MerR regulator
MMIGEVCEKLGIGETTLRRYEAMGVVPLSVRSETLQGRSIRVYTAQELERLRGALRRFARRVPKK